MVAITITKHDGTSKPKIATVKVEGTPTLKALREIAKNQKIMSPLDLFNVANSGISLPKAREERLNWTDIQDPEDRSVHINVGGKEFLMKDGLRRSEKESLFQKSCIGSGFNAAADEDGPKYTYRQVVANLSQDGIKFTPRAQEQQDVVTAYSSRVSSYLKAGWVDASLVAKTPWARFGVQASFSQSSARLDAQKHVYVTGRYNFAQYTMSMKDNIRQLKPDPEFKKAIIAALEIKNELDRRKEIKKLLDEYGSMFVTSVEVGGVKHSTIEEILDFKTTESSVRSRMQAILGKKFGPAGVGANISSGTDKRQTQPQEDEVESLHVYTIGGDIVAPSFVTWQKSLSDPHTWGVTRVLGVQSTLDLFDKDIQLKIAMTVCRTPLYRFTNDRGRHCLSTDSDSAGLPEGWDGHCDGGWFLGTAFTVPLNGAIPLYHVYHGKRHAFTNSAEELKKHVSSEEGLLNRDIVCYVYDTRKRGTIPLSRTWNKKLDDNDYVASATEEDVEAGKKRGYKVDESFRCYIYPK